MWQKLSLRMRLIALFALVLVLGLAINIGRLLLEAGPRVQAEDESVIRLAREFIEASVGDLKDSADPEAKLAAIVDGLQRLRHVTVTREGEAPEFRERIGRGGATGGPMRRRHGSSPWFARSRPLKACRLSCRANRSVRC